MALHTTPFDPADVIETAEDVAVFLEDAFAEGNASDIAHALGTVARSRGLTALAAETGISRQALHKALNVGGNPTLETLVKVLHALKLRITLQPEPA